MYIYINHSLPHSTVTDQMKTMGKDANETRADFNDDMPLGGFQAVTDIPLITIGLLSFLANAFVIRIILSKRALRTCSNLILISLAVSDMLTGIVTVPLILTCFVTVNHSVCMTSAIVIKFISISTIIHISLITVDWHMFIVQALRYYEIVRKRYVMIVLACSWLLTSFLALVRLSWTHDVNFTEDEEVQNEEHRFNYFCLGLFCALFIVNIVLDGHMLLILNRQVNKIIKRNLTRQCLEHENRIRSNQRRAVVMCAIMLLINVILWLPYFSYDLWQEAGPIPLAAEYVIINVRILSSLLNPVIYSFGQRTLRKAMVEKLRFMIPCKQTRGECKTEEIPLNQLT